MAKTGQNSEGQHPSSAGDYVPGTAPEAEQEPDGLSIADDTDDSTETDPFAQHSADERVEDDMGTLALHPDMVGGQDYGAVSTRDGGFAADLEAAAAKPAETGDADVMLRLKAGELECFDYLMNKYRRPIVHFMFRMVHNQAVAEEMAQEVFLRVYRSRETYRAEAKFSTWLYRIATNLAVNHARDTKNERASSEASVGRAGPRDREPCTTWPMQRQPLRQTCCGASA